MSIVSESCVIPPDLAGYQAIEFGLVKSGDVMVSKATRRKFFAPPSYWGMEIKEVRFDVYRKMACPKQGDHDHLPSDPIKAYFKKNPWVSAEQANKDLAEIGILGNPPDSKAKTNDGGKPPLAHLPWKALREVAQVQAFGKDKYGDFHNYRKGMEVGRNLSCACRHIADFMDGNDLDDETKRSHLASAALRCLFALQNLIEGTAIDDRYKK